MKGKRRRTKSGTNLLNLAETFMLLNAVSKNVMNQGIVDFIMRTDNDKSSLTLSLREVIDGLTGGTGGVYGPTASGLGIEQSPVGVMGHNLKQNWMPLAAQMIAIPVGFRLAKKIGRPVLTRTRKMLKDAGLKGTVTV